MQSIRYWMDVIDGEQPALLGSQGPTSPSSRGRGRSWRSNSGNEAQELQLKETEMFMVGVASFETWFKTLLIQPWQNWVSQRGKLSKTEMMRSAGRLTVKLHLHFKMLSSSFSQHHWKPLSKDFPRFWMLLLSSL